MLLPFKIGFGGKIASGKQWISWISLDDLLGIILHAINNESIKGPINAVVPNPVTNADFTNTLAAILSKPAKFNISSFIVKKVFGELADAALLASTRVVTSDILQKTGYQFRFLNLEMALRHTLGKTTIREDHKR
jgi:NAD dependent epimerase/dehydratase family enzyme